MKPNILFYHSRCVQILSQFPAEYECKHMIRFKLSVYLAVVNPLNCWQYMPNCVSFEWHLQRHDYPQAIAVKY